MHTRHLIRWAFRPDEERDESVVAEERIAASAAAAAAATADEVSTFIEQQPYDATNILDIGTNNRSRSSSVTTTAAGAAAAHGTMQRNQAHKSKGGVDMAAADDTWDHQQSPLGRLTTEELTALIQRNRVGIRNTPLLSLLIARVDSDCVSKKVQMDGSQCILGLPLLPLLLWPTLYDINSHHVCLDTLAWQTHNMQAGSRSCLSLLSSASAKVVVLMAWATWLLGGAAVYSWLNNWP